MKDKLFQMLKKIFAVIFIIGTFVAVYIYFPEITTAFKKISPTIIILLILMQIFTQILIALHWHLTSRLLDCNDSVLDFLLLNSYGTLLEAITPAVKSGGEGLKGILLVKNMNYSKRKAISLILIQKFFSLSGFCFVFILFSSKAIFNHWFYISIIGIIMIFLALTFIFKKKLPKISDSIKYFKSQRKLLFVISMLSVNIWLLLAIKVYIISLELGLSLPFFEVASISYLGYGAGLLPISPGGIGTAEGTMTFFLIQKGISAGQGLTLSLIARAITFWFVIVFSIIVVIILRLLNLNSRILAKFY